MKQLWNDRRPSPAAVIAVLALTVSLVGTAVAGPIAGIGLDKQEKKQTRKIASKIVNRLIVGRAAGLSVAEANRAKSADTAGTAGRAESAKSADEAKTAAHAGTAGSAGHANTAGSSGHAGTADFASTAGDAARLGGVDSGDYVRGPLEDVHRVGASGEPPLTNGCNNIGGFEPAGFYKDPFGIVHLVGDLFDCESEHGVVFVLPPGFRPPAAVRFVSLEEDTTTATIRVDPNGDVRTFSNPKPSLNGIYFRTD